MNKSSSLNERLVFILIIGILALNYPLMAIIDKPVFLKGIPVLYLYLFFIWSCFIGLVAFTLRKNPRPKPLSKKTPPPGKL